MIKRPPFRATRYVFLKSTRYHIMAWVLLSVPILCSIDFSISPAPIPTLKNMAWKKHTLIFLRWNRFPTRWSHCYKLPTVPSTCGALFLPLCVRRDFAGSRLGDQRQTRVWRLCGSERRSYTFLSLFIEQANYFVLTSLDIMHICHCLPARATSVKRSVLSFEVCA